MLGAAEVFDDPHWFWSDQYDVSGADGGRRADLGRMVVRGSLEDRSFCAFLLDAAGVLRSTVSVDWPRDVRRSFKLISAAVAPDPAALADPDVDLRKLVPTPGRSRGCLSAAVRLKIPVDARGIRMWTGPRSSWPPAPRPSRPRSCWRRGARSSTTAAPGFGNIMRDVTGHLKELYRTDADVLLMTSSGTGGLESAVANCFSPGDEVLVPLAGFFAERFKRGSPRPSGSPSTRSTTSGARRSVPTTSRGRSPSIRSRRCC